MAPTTASLRRLEAWARVRLQMPREEFRSLTLREWNAIVKEYQAMVEEQEERRGAHLLIVAKAGGMKRRDGSDLTLSDFYQSPEQRKRAKRQRKPSTYKQFMAIFGHRVTPCPSPSAPSS